MPNGPCPLICKFFVDAVGGWSEKLRMYCCTTARHERVAFLILLVFLLHECHRYSNRDFEKWMNCITRKLHNIFCQNIIVLFIILLVL